MKTILKSLTLQIPEGVTLTLKAREITVKGPRGTIVRSFKHMPIDISFTDDTEREIVIERWFTSGKANASIRTCHSHITNAIIGVTKGFQYKMRFVYAHFPINVAITNKDKRVEIRNFLGEKVVRIVDALADVTVRADLEQLHFAPLVSFRRCTLGPPARIIKSLCTLPQKHSTF